MITRLLGERMNFGFIWFCIIYQSLYCLVGESLDDLISHCKTLMESMGSTENVESNWTKRMTIMQEDWTKGRSSIFKWVVSDENHHSDQCSFCFANEANVRCHQCGLSFYMCNTCDERLHSSNPFHDREIWNERFFEAIAPAEKFDNFRKTESGMFLIMNSFYTFWLF